MVATSFEETSTVTDQKKKLEFRDGYQVDATIYFGSLFIFQQVCCTISLTDKEMFMLDKALSVRSSLSEAEESTLYYVLDYLAFKKNIAVVELTATKKYFSSSEFTILLFRGKSSHPPPESF